MIRLNILAVGKLKEKFWRDAIQEYNKRIQKYASLTITEVADLPDGADRQKEEEARQILAKTKGYTVLLDIKGDSITSEGLAELISEKSVYGISEFTFVVGGSRGVDDSVLAKADQKISFGAVTYPHQLMRVMLAEQLYRALTIINKTGYHK